MKAGRMYRIISMVLACLLTVVSVDVNVLAAAITEDVVEIQQEIGEDELLKNVEIVEEETSKATEQEIGENEFEEDKTFGGEVTEEVVVEPEDWNSGEEENNREDVTDNIGGEDNSEETDTSEEEFAETIEDEKSEGINSFLEKAKDKDLEDGIMEENLNTEEGENDIETVEVTEEGQDESDDEDLELQWINISAPVSNIASGNFITEDAVIRLSTESLDARIYYTTDGTEPVTEDGIPCGILYTDGIRAGKIMQSMEGSEINENKVILKAYAMKEGNYDSEVVTFEYTVENESARWGEIEAEDRTLYATEAMPEGNASLVPAGMWIAGIKEEGYVYTGKNITFDWDREIRVYDGKKRLSLNQDYTVSYKNNKNVYPWKEGDPQYRASKAPTITLKGKGNYAGTITRIFEICPMDISTLKEDGTPLFNAPDITLAFNNKVQKGTTKVTYVNEDGKTVTLKAKKDFNYIYNDKDETIEGNTFIAYKDAKETPYTVTIEGKGNYTGTLTFGQTITKSILMSKAKVKSIPAQTFETGKEQTPEVTVTYKGKTLTEYKEETGEGDYTLCYKNNRNPGTASVIITGKGDYVGTKTVTFKINGYDLRKAKMEGFQSSFVFSGDGYTQEKVTFSYTIGKGANATTIPLYEGTHYNVQYTKCDNLCEVGSIQIVYTGIEENGCFGTVKKTYKITPYDLGKDTDNRLIVTDEEGKAYPQPVNYVKGGAKPNPKVVYKFSESVEYTLEEGIDYKLSYSNNTKLNDGTNPKKMPTIKITGMGNFKGTRKKDNFTIGNSDISGLNLMAADKVYANKKGNFATSVVITDMDGKKLKAGTDYEKNFEYYYYESVNVKNDGEDREREAGDRVEEKDIVPVGAVLSVVAKGKGIYRGIGEQPSTISGLYRVVQADIGKATVKVNKQYYAGKEVCPNKSQIVVTLKGQVLSNKDYEIVSYSNNHNKGTAKVTIRGVGNYGGTKTVNFTIANKSMSYIISFNANGATSGTMKDMQIKYGKSYTLTKNAYKKQGYDFVGWNTESDGSGKDTLGNVILYKDMEQDPVVVGKNDMGRTLILYAQWELEKYTITYHLNNGNNHEQNVVSYTVEDEVTFKEPTREGYTFLGWYTDSKFTKKISSITKGTTGDKELYAKWRVSVIEEVPVPEEGTYLDVRDYDAYPDDETDDTDAIERAIRVANRNYTRAKEDLEDAYGEAAAEMEVDAVNTVYLPAGTYNITPGATYAEGEPGVNILSNVNLIMSNEAVLYVEGSSFEEYCVFSIKNAENITIQGGKIQGERYRHDGTSSEHGHGIALFGGKNVEISNVFISSNWGDGIYLGTQPVRQSDGSQLYVGCDNVIIKNCEIIDNRRSNISLVDVDNLTIDHCYIADAHGTAPQCGIYIEPNWDNKKNKEEQICVNIEIRDTTIDTYKNKNSDKYMCFMTHHNPYKDNYTTAENIRFINCRLNGFVGNYSGKNFSVDKNTVITGEYVNMR